MLTTRLFKKEDLTDIEINDNSKKGFDIITTNVDELCKLNSVAITTVNENDDIIMIVMVIPKSERVGDLIMFSSVHIDKHKKEVYLETVRLLRNGTQYFDTVWGTADINNFTNNMYLYNIGFKFQYAKDGDNYYSLDIKEDLC